MIHYRDRATSIVVVGQFAPARYHPEWFVRNQLMSEEDASEVDIVTVGPAASQWMHPRLGDFVILPDRMTFTCRNEALWMAARDLVESIVVLDAGNVVTAVGMNLHMIASVDGEDANPVTWNALGDVLAPKELWRDALALPDKDGFPGLEAIRISVPDGDPNLPGSRRIFAFEPILASQYELAILINNHFDLARAQLNEAIAAASAEDVALDDVILPDPSRVEHTLQLLADRYENAIAESREQTETLLVAALKKARAVGASSVKRRANEG